MRMLVATDAWHSQINSVVPTLAMIAESATALGHEISFRSAPAFIDNMPRLARASDGADVMPVRPHCVA